MDRLEKYLEKTPGNKRSKAAIAFLATLDHLSVDHPQVARGIIQELKDQRSHLKLIASENFSSLASQLAMGNLLTDKYAEGYAHRRFYAGCENVDALEELASDGLRALFGCDHAYVQPHCGADANMVGIWAFLTTRFEEPAIKALGKKNIDELTDAEYEEIRKVLVSQKMMGMGLTSGGHLTHGYRRNVSSKIFHSVSYEVDPQTGWLDYDVLAKQVKKERPSLLIAGYSAYPRLINFATMKEIADSVGAILMSDIAHFAGLVAGKAIQGEYDPTPYSDIVTSTTHKTLRGPRGGVVMCKEPFKDAVNRGCPLVLGGPLPHVIAAKAVAFKEANCPDFQKYAHKVIANAKVLADRLVAQGARVLTGGTDNHLVLFEVSDFGITGRQAELALRKGGLTVNRNAIPFDPNGAWFTSGVRIGTAALTTLGMGTAEMEQIALLIVDLLKGTTPGVVEKTGAKSRAQVKIDPQVLSRVQIQVKELLAGYPLYPEIPQLQS